MVVTCAAVVEGAAAVVVVVAPVVVVVAPSVLEGATEVVTVDASVPVSSGEPASPPQAANTMAINSTKAVLLIADRTW